MANIEITSVKTVNQLLSVENIHSDSAILATETDSSNTLKRVSYGALSAQFYTNVSSNIYANLSEISDALSTEISSTNTNLSNNYYPIVSVFNKDELTAVTSEGLNNGLLPNLSNNIVGVINDVSGSLITEINDITAHPAVASITNVGGFQILNTELNNETYENLYLSVISADNETDDNSEIYGVAIMTKSAVDNILPNTNNYASLSVGILNAQNDIQLLNESFEDIKDINKDVDVINILNTQMLGTLMRQNYLSLSIDNEKFVQYFRSLESEDILSILLSVITTYTDPETEELTSQIQPIENLDEIIERINNLSIYISAYLDSNQMKSQFNAKTFGMDGQLISSDFHNMNIAGSDSTLSAIYGNLSQPIVELKSKYGLDFLEESISGGLQNAIRFLPNDVWVINPKFDQELASSLSLDLNNRINFENATIGNKDGLLWQSVDQLSANIDQIYDSIDQICVNYEKHSTISSICNIDSDDPDQLYQSLSSRIWSDISAKVVELTSS